jgi:hypothetical protein
MSQVERLELSLDHAKELVAKRDQALKLTSNREYKKLVTEGYLKDEAVRLVGLSADPSVAQHDAEIQLAIKAISLFRQYMQNIIRMGDVAEASIQSHEDELELARLQEAEGAY